MTCAGPARRRTIREQPRLPADAKIEWSIVRIQIFLYTVLLLSCSLDADAQRRKNKKDVEPPTQVLELLPEPPDAVVAETAKLSFRVSPLSAKGLLSQQVRDAIKALQKDSHGATILKLRAFVAGSGDLRRVSAIVAEEFTDDKQPLPAVSTIQVGALPMVGAQVVMESTSAERKPVNPNGLVFLSSGSAADPRGAAAELKKRAMGIDLLRITCFMSSLEDMPAVREGLAPDFRAVETIFVQMQRQATERQTGCEAVGRLPAGGTASNSIEAATITAPKIVLTGTKLVFRDQDSDVRLMFERLGKSMEPLGASLKDVRWANVFALTRPMNAKVNELRGEFFDNSRAIAGASLVTEGLPSIDATAAVELIAVAR